MPRMNDTKHDPVTILDVITVGMVFFSGIGVGILFTVTAIGR